MQSCNEQVLSLVKNAPLSAEEVALWEQISPNIPENLCPSLLEVINASQDSIRTLTNSLKEKAAAIKNQDAKVWDDILKKEDDLLISLINK